MKRKKALTNRRQKILDHLNVKRVTLFYLLIQGVSSFVDCFLVNLSGDFYLDHLSVLLNFNISEICTLFMLLYYNQNNCFGSKIFKAIIVFFLISKIIYLIENLRYYNIL